MPLGADFLSQWLIISFLIVLSITVSLAGITILENVTHDIELVDEN